MRSIICEQTNCRRTHAWCRVTCTICTCKSGFADSCAYNYLSLTFSKSKWRIYEETRLRFGESTRISSEKAFQLFALRWVYRLSKLPDRHDQASANCSLVYEPRSELHVRLDRACFQKAWDEALGLHFAQVHQNELTPEVI